ncbi:MAG: NrtA/SsuA/CpmA family ABC transporter substrate-binding protein [Treponema sp.]|nr:NrtA/SsuA/CpmA family ABC transporter substrate-binding protein [Treponema sp.]
MKKSFTTILLILFCIAFFPLQCLHAQTRYPKTINISYVEAPFNLQIIVMKERRMLENAFAPLGVSVRWHVINSGADQTQAMAAGSLDIASVINSTSVILANAAGNPVEIAALVSRPQQTFALMVGPNGPRTIRELRGKTIAGPKGSVLHQMLIAALVKEGMKASDVRLINMGLPEARTALLSNRVDGALQAAGFIIRNEEAGMRTLFTADGYLTTLLFTAVRPEFAKNYPELLRIYLQVQKEAYNWITEHTTEAVSMGSRLQQVSAADGMKLFRWSGIAQIMEQSDVLALREDVDFLFRQKMIERKINPSQFILPVAFSR